MTAAESNRAGCAALPEGVKDFMGILTCRVRCLRDNRLCSCALFLRIAFCSDCRQSRKRVSRPQDNGTMKIFSAREKFGAVPSFGLHRTDRVHR